MGFGLLFTGYLLTFLMYMSLWAMYGWAFRIVGYTVMAYACLKLREYFPKFNYVYYCLFGLWLTGAAETVCGIWSFFTPEAPWIAAVTTYVEYVTVPLVLVFHVFLLSAVSRASEEVGLDDKRTSAITALIFIFIGFVTRVLALIGAVPMGLSILVQLVGTVFVLVLLFGCYMRICPAGDEDMPRKKSRFGFVNRFADALDKKEQESFEQAKRDLESGKKKREEQLKRKKRK